MSQNKLSLKADRNQSRSVSNQCCKLN